MDTGDNLRLGAALLGQGRALEAEHVLQQALVDKPDDFDALHLLGVIAAQTGRGSRAVELISRAIARNDTVAAAHYHFALALLAVGRRIEAVASFERAIALRPKMALAHVNLSALLVDLQRFAQALDHAGRALALQPDSVPALLNRAAALRALGRSADALADYEQVLSLEPDNLAACHIRGDLLLALNSPKQALASYDSALTRAPESADLHASCAAAYLALNRPEEALASSLTALRLRPDLFAGHLNCAAAQLAMHRFGAALVAYERALALKPGSAAAHCGRGDACREMGDRGAAAESYRRALAIEPDHAGAHLGLLLNTVPVIPESAEEIDGSRLELAEQLTRFDEWQAAQPLLDEPALVARAQPFYIAYQERPNRELLMRWGSLSSRLMQRWAARECRPAARIDGRSHGRVRVGIVTAHAYQHSVYRALLKGWVEQLDHDRLSISVFHLGARQDAAASALARTRAELLECFGLSLGECVRAIRDRRIEVLLYPEIGLDAVTFQLASLRLARHQIVAWGHPETTGLPTIDYFLSSAAFEPPQAEDCYSEKLIRLPNIGCYYEPLDIAATTSLGGLSISAELPLLLSPGMPYKYAAARDGVFVAIARALPRCQIVFFEATQEVLTARVQARIRAAFRAAGLDPERHIKVLPWLSREAFYGLLRGADVYLDTLGFSGFNTVMQAVECGVPIAAYEGRFMRGRFASGVMREIGLDELVASSETEYVRNVVRLVRDRSFNEAIRQRLERERHRLYCDRAPIDALNAFLTSLPR